jgi:hypothetical protein
MTAIVGVLCRDGVVIGSDSASTSSTRSGPMGFRTIETPAKKITIIDDKIIVCGSGEVGLHQRFCFVLDVLSKGNAFSAHPIQVATQITQMVLAQFAQTNIHKGNIDYSALVAFHSGSEFKLCEFALGSLEPSFRSDDLWFACLGSGQPITDPFLGFLRKIFWPYRNAPGIKEGTFFTAWALHHVIDVNPGGINGPIQLAILESGDTGPVARSLDEGKIEEHRASVLDAEHYLEEYREKIRGQDTQGLPPIPGVSS